jgi:DNA polymerase I-like protein with 3'-5' exonuclease and polymerase domains
LQQDLIEFKEPVDVQLIEHLLSKIEEVSITITDNNKTFSLTNKTGKKSINVGIKSSLSSNNVMCIELTEERSVKVVMKVLYERSIRIVCYDSHLLLMVLLMQYGVTLGNWCIFDLKLADYLLMPDKPSSTFEDLLTRYDANNSHIERNWNLSRQFPLMDLLCHELYGKQLWHLYSNLEMKVSPIIATMECVGLLINRQLLISYCDTLKTKLKNIESNAFELVGHSFSLTSTAQLREVLFNKLELDRKCQSSLQKTVVNKLTSTSEPVLIQLSPHHPLPGMILQYRQLSKLKSLIDSILTHSIDGYLRPNWLHCGSVTGRVCCCNPNMQGFPKQVCHVELQGVVKKKFVTIDVRSCVISRNDHSFVAIDFKSIELRLLAHFSHDDLLCGILSHDSSVDVFQMLASEWFGLSLENVTSSQREKAKRVVYAIVYGVGKERLAEMLQISIESAYELMKSFLKRFSGVQNWINYCLAECRKTKYCNSLCGRKRWFDGINSADYVARATLERQAVNFIIQGAVILYIIKRKSFLYIFCGY